MCSNTTISGYPMTKPTDRFTKTVQDYIKYRPSYQKKVIKTLEDDCNLTKSSIIADVGSGTGILTKLLLDHGNTVSAVEPNQTMREAAETLLKDYAHFISINGTAEQTTLDNNSIDLITVGTAFHWFDPKKTKIEFQRILKSNGWVLLVWNVRNNEDSALMQDYESLISRVGTNYENLTPQRFNQYDLESFFSPNQMHTASFAYSQHFDWEGLKGRLLSTSYSPREGDANYESTINELKKIFQRYQKNGLIEFLYTTKLYYGMLR